MPNPLGELIGEWLARAEHDLRVAEFLLTMPNPPPESIVQVIRLLKCKPRMAANCLIENRRAARSASFGFYKAVCTPVPSRGGFLSRSTMNCRLT
jgi:hypothetical protein